MSLISLLGFLTRRQPTSCRSPRRRRFFEQLEDRRVLAVVPTITLGGGGGQAGELDTSFSDDGWQTSHVAEEQAYDVVVDDNGNTIVVGDRMNGGTRDFIVARYKPDGSIDDSFGVGGFTIIDFGGEDFGRGVALDGAKIVVAGYSSGEQTDVAIARLNDNGTLDTTFNSAGSEAGELVWDLAVGAPGSNDEVTDVAVQSDGSIVVVGNTLDFVNEAFLWHVSRVTVAGVPDSGFDVDEDDVVEDDGVWTLDFGDFGTETAVGVAIQDADGKIIVAGSNNDAEFAVVRLLADGADDSSFNNPFGRNAFVLPAPGEASDMALQSDGSVVVVGTLREGGDDKIAMVRFLANGSPDLGFGDGGLARFVVSGLDLQGNDVVTSNGKIIVAGRATDTSVSPNKESTIVARFLSDGSPDSTFGDAGLVIEDLNVFISGQQEGAGQEVAEAVAIDPTNGKIVVAGWHTAATNDLAVARLIPEGTGTPLDLTGFEGELKSISGTFIDGLVGTTHSIVIDWGDGSIPETLSLTPTEIANGTFSATHVFADDSDLVTAKIMNGNTFVTDTTADADIDNLPPSATITGPLAGLLVTGLTFSGVRGQPLTFTGINSDPGILDTHIVTWDFSDLPALVDQTGTTASRTYAQAGTYTFTLTVDDQDPGGKIVVPVTVTIADFQLQTAPCGCGMALVVGGTDGADSIAVNAVTGGLAVFLNGVQLVTGSPSHGVVVYGSGGDDEVQVQGSIVQTAWLYGGLGNDRLKGGGGSDVILGQQGDDLLVGGSGRDLLIGGLGGDRIVGNSDDDILISGTTDHDNNAVALCGILKEWTSSRCDYVRVANIYGCGTGPRHNGTYFLNDSTVHDDGVRDLLTGSSGFDWFFANLSLCGDDSLTKDKITDLNWWEFAKDIDFIGT